ncbi:MAG TPA: hypothetical protein VMW66_00910 [Elusimicrobiales bacterium]|nr:hypothetical protein [Elusimicrobiales bacterium]
MKFVNLVITIIALPVILILLKLLWAFTVPEIFPGAIKQGLIVATLSWTAAFKLAVFIFIVGLFIRSKQQ